MSPAAPPLHPLRVVDQRVRAGQASPAQEFDQIVVAVGQAQDLAVRSDAPTACRRRAVHDYQRGSHVPMVRRRSCHSTPSSVSRRRICHAGPVSADPGSQRHHASTSTVLCSSVQSGSGNGRHVATAVVLRRRSCYSCPVRYSPRCQNTLVTGPMTFMATVARCLSPRSPAASASRCWAAGPAGQRRPAGRTAHRSRGRRAGRLQRRSYHQLLPSLIGMDRSAAVHCSSTIGLRSPPPAPPCCRSATGSEAWTGVPAGGCGFCGATVIRGSLESGSARSPIRFLPTPSRPRG